MDRRDDELKQFEATGAEPLPETGERGRVENAGASIWYAAFGTGFPVILLHGGLGHAGNWGHQIADLVDAGYRAILIDSRGHGRSTHDGRAFSYDLMASDVLAVMDNLSIEQVALVGWSDGACTALALARQTPKRVAGVFFFACNVDASGTKPVQATPALDRCFARHKADYAALSPTPGGFDALLEALQPMQASQPDYSARDLEAIRVPVTVAQSELDEFIRTEHARYVADTIPGARFAMLSGVSHFAPLQRPRLFNDAVLGFLSRLDWSS
ncbi:alpha/beta fold hydrolase [Devosia nitrariae]|uniref:Alpha/beta hydrolase n=1 Tax=Devosia nitrariae TaxID=2071872 RepID=A0ABQ5W4R8_9HYPH|nr:alpha/beta hydrolase [Devosia nitrariae]GLQ55070.1 alpha/beta hydrolase [Devosia nitrariae]